MSKPAGPVVRPAGRTSAAAAKSALVAAACVAVVGACSSPQQAATTTGTPPTVWTGTPAPSTSGHAEPAPSTQEAPPSGQTITTVLKGSSGQEVATAKFDFANGYATVTITATSSSGLAPGFHGVHVHSVGKCEGDFASAGGHLKVPGATGHSSGDLTSLQVRKDGAALLVTTTDGFTMDDLVGGAKTSIIIHEGPDNFMNIPNRYQVNGAPGPDETTMTTGDAGKRVACGVIGSG